MANAPLPEGLLKSAPEDFRVEEIPLYLPEGSGDHLYLTFEKRGLTTPQAVRALGDALGVPNREIGVAGMKDRHAITVQTISLPASGKFARIDDAVGALALPGITVLSAARHRNKLKTGHLAGNRFAIRVRDVAEDAAEAVAAAFLETERRGVPNYYGEQRFGHDGDNVARALTMLREGRGPRDPKQRRFLFSAAQSEVFNQVLARRVADGTWSTPQRGDLLEKTGSHAVFLCEDPAVDGPRCDAFEVCPTGPMPGVAMKRPEGDPGALEAAITAAVFGDDFPWDRTRALGEGARRALRLQVQSPRVRVEASSQGRSDMTFEFMLARGSYATTVLGSLLTLREPRTAAAGATTEGAPESEELEA